MYRNVGGGITADLPEIFFGTILIILVWEGFRHDHLVRLWPLATSHPQGWCLTDPEFSWLHGEEIVAFLLSWFIQDME